MYKQKPCQFCKVRITPIGSYSERQLYEAALERLTRELAAVQGMDERGAQQRVDEVLTARAA